MDTLHCWPRGSVTAFQPRHANKTGENAYPLGGIIHVFVRPVVAKTAAAPAPSAEPRAELRTSPPGRETTHSLLGKQGLGSRGLGCRVYRMTLKLGALSLDFFAWLCIWSLCRRTSAALICPSLSACLLLGLYRFKNHHYFQKSPVETISSPRDLVASRLR